VAFTFLIKFTIQLRLLGKLKSFSCYREENYYELGNSKWTHLSAKHRDCQNGAIIDECGLWAKPPTGWNWSSKVSVGT
jgi:hypothetical protein